MSLELYGRTNDGWESWLDGTKKPVSGGSPGTWVGGYRSIGGSPTLSGWQSASTAHGPWTIGRSFPWPQGIYADLDGELFPNLFSIDKIAWPSLSLTSSINCQSIINGNYDQTLKALANWFPGGTGSQWPSTLPCYLTFQHEWENHLDAGTPAEYAQMYRHVYPLMKSENSNLKIVPIAASWQWRDGADYQNVGIAGFPGSDYVDGLSIDQYWQEWQGRPQSLLNLANHSFVNWYNWASEQGVPLHVTEWAYWNTGDDSRGDAIAEFGNWAIDQGFESLQYWDSDKGAGGTTGTAGWNVDGDPWAIQQLKALADRGRTLT